MKKALLVIALSIVLVVALAVPALAAPPFDKNGPAHHGMGRMFGEHISTEAKAGVLGPEVHPGMHHGFAGWEMPMPM